MRLIKPSFEIIEQQPGEVGLFKHIETCGRVAWKSEEKTSDESYKKFIDMIKGVNHGSVLEHGTVYLKLNNEEHGTVTQIMWKKYRNDKYSKVYHIASKKEPWFSLATYVTTNYRVLVDNNWLDDLKYACEPTDYHEKRTTVRFVCDRGVSHEFVRHRVFSFTQESTRYCNYSKDKFGNELTFIEPCWELRGSNFISMLEIVERAYIELTNIRGWKAQQARAILPNSLKTELIMTGFESDWEHFFMLRTAVGAHPQARELAEPLYAEFEAKVFNKFNANEIIDIARETYGDLAVVMDVSDCKSIDEVENKLKSNK
jgi:thymidylate synthase (FAD)